MAVANVIIDMKWLGRLYINCCNVTYCININKIHDILPINYNAEH